MFYHFPRNTFMRKEKSIQERIWLEVAVPNPSSSSFSSSSWWPYPSPPSPSTQPARWGVCLNFFYNGNINVHNNHQDQLELKEHAVDRRGWANIQFWRYHQVPVEGYIICKTSPFLWPGRESSAAGAVRYIPATGWIVHEDSHRRMQ